MFHFHFCTQEDLRKAVTCRYDWHQTAGFVTISVFAKLANSEQTTIECNGVKTKMSISFEAGKNLFQQEFNLRGVSLLFWGGAGMTLIVSNAFFNISGYYTVIPPVLIIGFV